MLTPTSSTPDATTPAQAAPVMIVALVWLPTSPPRPAPAVMTEDEVCIMLNINSRCLRAYHDAGRLRGWRCSRTLRWNLSDVLAFANSQKELSQ